MESTWALGNLETKVLPPSEADLISNFFGANISKISLFKRLKKGDDIILLLCDLHQSEEEK